jgi:hypothetical protein
MQNAAPPLITKFGGFIVWWLRTICRATLQRCRSGWSPDPGYFL